MLADQQRLHFLRSPQRRQACLEPALRQMQEAVCVVHDQLGAGLTARMQRTLCPAAARSSRVSGEQHGNAIIPPADKDAKSGAGRRVVESTKLGAGVCGC